MPSVFIPHYGLSFAVWKQVLSSFRSGMWSVCSALALSHTQPNLCGSDRKLSKPQMMRGGCESLEVTSLPPECSAHYSQRAGPLWCAWPALKPLDSSSQTSVTSLKPFVLDQPLWSQKLARGYGLIETTTNTSQCNYLHFNMFAKQNHQLIPSLSRQMLKPTSISKTILYLHCASVNTEYKGNLHSSQVWRFFCWANEPLDHIKPILENINT